MDINPVVEGHVLVISKKQVEFVWDLSDDEYQGLMQTVRKVALQQRNELQTPYVGQMIVGVDVPHAHVHVLPFSDAKQWVKSHPQSEPDHDALAKMAEKLKF